MKLNKVKRNIESIYNIKESGWKKISKEKLELEPDSNDPQILEEIELNKADPNFEKKLQDLDAQLKEISDPKMAYYLIETSFLRDFEDSETEQRIKEIESEQLNIIY